MLVVLSVVGVPMTTGGLWRCPRCGAGFVTKNMSHSCGRFGLDPLFEGKPEARRLYDHFLRFARQVGDFEVIPQKTRITFLAKTRFAGVQRIGKDHLMLQIGLPRRLDSPRVHSVEKILAWYVHLIRVTKSSAFDDELRSWLQESHDEMGLRRTWLDGNLQSGDHSD